MIRSILLSVLLSGTLAFAQGKIVINELMQSNVDFLMVDHDFPDSWVELYNGSDKSVNVEQFRIGTSNEFSEAVQLTSAEKNIESKQYLLLYCDKTTDKPFHYNFNLESSKGSLYLFNKKGEVVDSITYPKMPAPNVAYGRIADGGDKWQYELEPTPGKTNDGTEEQEVSQDVLPAPLFSAEGHLMTNGAETITITMPDSVPKDTRIYLTTDGSEPTWESDNGKNFTIKVDSSMVIRAKLLSKQMLPSISTTHSYIFHPRDTKLPIVSIVTNNEFLYSSEEGIFSEDSTDGKPNYSYDWRRPANFEYFNTQDGKTIFNQNGEMAVGGNYSRVMPQKSIKCYAKNRFGKKNFKGNFWRDKPEVTKVKSFLLRNGGGNSKYARIEDAAIQKFFGTNIDEIDWQAYEPVIVYINGVYKGIYEFRERSNEDYVSSNYGIDDKEVEIATANSYITPKKKTYFYDFHAMYHKDDITYKEMDEAMNIDNFMNAFIAESYSSNTDYPKNNVSIWRQIGMGERTDIKWHWILKDLDFVSMHDATWNMFKYMLGTESPDDDEYASSNIQKVVLSRYLYEKMISFPEFRERFIATYATYLGDFLRPDVCLPIVDEMDKEIANEIEPTFAANKNMSKLKKYNTYLNKFRTYITERPQNVYQQMADYFSLGDVIPVQIYNTENKDTIAIGKTSLRTGEFNGAWFTEFPLTLSVKSEKAKWTMTVKHANGKSDTYTYDKVEIQPDLKKWTSGDSVIFKVSPQKTDNPVSISKITGFDSSIKVWTMDGTVYIQSKPGTEYRIIDIFGRSLKAGVTQSSSEEIFLDKRGGIAVVRIEKKAFKMIRY